MEDNTPAVVHKTAEIPVAEFEGEYVRKMVGKIPQINMEMPVGYRRGTHLKLEIEVRVGNIAVNEGKGKEKGDLVREHTLHLEEVRLVGVYTAQELDPGVGGSASAAAIGSDDDPDQDPLPYGDGEEETQTEGDQEDDGRDAVGGDSGGAGGEEGPEQDPGF